MNFCDTMLRSLLESLRAAAGFDKEDMADMAVELMKDASCRALQEIWEVLGDDSLEDPECFWRIEKIVGIYEKLGSNGGGRHDFG
jgi:hypothetical protein